MRLEEVYGDRLGLAPGDCGVGGGFVLIEIDDTDDEGRVSYRYTDYYVYPEYIRLEYNMPRRVAAMQKDAVSRLPAEYPGWMLERQAAYRESLTN